MIEDYSIPSKVILISPIWRVREQISSINIILIKLYHIPFKRECSRVPKNAKNIFLQNPVWLCHAKQMIMPCKTSWFENYPNLDKIALWGCWSVVSKKIWKNLFSAFMNIFVWSGERVWQNSFKFLKIGRLTLPS